MSRAKFKIPIGNKISWFAMMWGFVIFLGASFINDIRINHINIEIIYLNGDIAVRSNIPGLSIFQSLHWLLLFFGSL